ncbi:MAG TPA: VOC family protein [Pseudobdellovibrionaceae bacterium]|jgi:catechol 2,3-dioxygenase-like lactoylglutathione lyase family enzyme
MSETTGLLHHVNIKVSDLKKSTEFWGWFLKMLGWELYDSWPKGVSYKLGPTYLDFVQAEEQYANIPHQRDLVGLNHFAFHGRSRSHIDEITNTLRERGVNILYQDQHPFAGGPSYYAVYFEDPNKFKVEVVAPD